MKSLKQIFVILIAICAINMVSVAQSDSIVKPLRIGVKFGVPNLIGFNAEYVLPVGKGLAPSVDFSYIPYPATDVSGVSVTTKFIYWSIGANYYFFKPGKGLYGGLSYGNVSIKASGTKTDSQFGTGTGEATANVSYSILKIGVKWGRTFYFRPEVGLAMVNYPKSIDITLKYSGKTEVQSVDLPAINFPFIFNIGFGFAF